MIIRSTQNSKFLPKPTPVKTTETSSPKDSVELGTGTVLGGIGLGVSGALLGGQLGMKLAADAVSKTVADSHPLVQVTALLVTLPTTLLYTAAGVGLGASIGGVAGSGLGYCWDSSRS